MLIIAVHMCFKVVNGQLACAFVWMNDYVSFIKVLFDIASRAVEAEIRENMPAARTNKEKIKYRKIKFFIAITIMLFSMVNFFVKKPDFAVHVLLCKKFKGGDIIFD